MKISETDLPGVLRIEPSVFEDARGYFFENFSERRFAEHGVPSRFVQDNVSCSAHGTLRGLHLQSPPFAQGKLVQVLYGEVFDVAVDVRHGSPNFGKWTGMALSALNRVQLYVPPGFAHGFCVTSEQAVFAYKCSEYYAPGSELTVAWNDPDIGIAWPIAAPALSPKDASAPRLRDLPRDRFTVFGNG